LPLAAVQQSHPDDNKNNFRLSSPLLTILMLAIIKREGVLSRNTPKPSSLVMAYSYLKKKKKTLPNETAADGAELTIAVDITVIDKTYFVLFVFFFLFYS
jgi:hypothetical protein